MTLQPVRKLINHLQAAECRLVAPAARSVTSPHRRSLPWSYPYYERRAFATRGPPSPGITFSVRHEDRWFGGYSSLSTECRDSHESAQAIWLPWGASKN